MALPVDGVGSPAIRIKLHEPNHRSLECPFATPALSRRWDGTRNTTRPSSHLPHLRDGFLRLQTAVALRSAKLLGARLLERDGTRYATLLPQGGSGRIVHVFHKRLCGPIANSRSTPPPPQAEPNIARQPARSRLPPRDEPSKTVRRSLCPQPDLDAHHQKQRPAAPKRTDAQSDFFCPENAVILVFSKPVVRPQP